MSNLEKSAVAMNLVKVSFTLTPKKGNAKEYSIYVQFSSVVQLCPTLWDPPGLQHARLPCPSPSTWICLSSHPFNWWPFILCHPLLLLPSIFSSIRVFPNESALSIRWAKSWSFSFSISPYNEYSGLISFRINWFDIFAAWKTLKSLLQHFGSWNYLLVYVSPTQVVGLNYFASLLLLSISLWFLLYIFTCRKPFLLVFRAFLYQYLFQCWDFYKKLSLHSFSYHLYWIYIFLTFQCLKLEALRKTNGEGNGTPLQYSCLENPMDAGAW